MTLTEVLIASTLLVVLLTLLVVTMSMITNVQTTVSSQFQEFDQAAPALAPIQALLRAQVEPAPVSAGKPTPPFAAYGSTSLNFGVQFYANVGTAYNNCVGCNTQQPTTAGPAKIVALEVDQAGNPVTSSTQCKASSPCSFQVRRFLPIVNSGISTCPVAIDGTAGGTCQYPATYVLITNVLHVVNNPSNVSGGAPQQPIFTYGFFDPDWPAPSSTGTGILFSALEVQNNLLTGLTGAPYNYPTATQQVTACAASTSNGSYRTRAIACPLDAIQSVALDLMVAAPGAGPNGTGTVDNQTVVYRYPPTGTSNNLVYPYQFTSAVG